MKTQMILGWIAIVAGFALIVSQLFEVEPWQGGIVLGIGIAVGGAIAVGEATFPDD